MVNIRNTLIEIKNALSLLDVFIDIYIFGSSLHTKMPSDIDILIIYSSEDQLSYIKNAFSSLGLLYPLDIYYMTLTETQELKFIVKTGAVKLS